MTLNEHFIRHARSFLLFAAPNLQLCNLLSKVEFLLCKVTFGGNGLFTVHRGHCKLAL